VHAAHYFNLRPPHHFASLDLPVTVLDISGFLHVTRSKKSKIALFTLRLARCTKGTDPPPLDRIRLRRTPPPPPSNCVLVYRLLEFLKVLRSTCFPEPVYSIYIPWLRDTSIYICIYIPKASPSWASPCTLSTYTKRPGRHAGNTRPSSSSPRSDSSPWILRYVFVLVRRL
jgi:hypothetical protein